MTADHKDYALKQVENFLYDAMSADATAQEIYDVIKGVVEDNYHVYKNATQKAYELLALLNGNGEGHISDAISRGNKVHQAMEDLILECDKEDASPECIGDYDWFKWDYDKVYVGPIAQEVKEDCMPPWGHSDMEALKYTDKEMDAMCSATEEEELISKGYFKENGFWKKPKTWTVEVSMDGLTGDAFLPIPDEVMDLVEWNLYDELEWIDNKDGSWIIRKVTK